jgi:hypothetical protein
MEDLSGHNKDLKKLFNLILGVDVNIKDNIDQSEELIFKKFIDKLEASYNIENKVFETSGIDLTKVTDGLWFVVENTLKMLYGEVAGGMIVWYIYDRFDADGSIVPLEDANGKQFLLKNSDDLWSYIKYKSNI